MRTSISILIGCSLVFLPLMPAQVIQEGLRFTGSVKSEQWNVRSGTGPHRNASILHADLLLNGSLAEVIPVSGVSVLFQAFANNGGSVSRFSRDLQMVSNIESYRTVKLFQAWVQYAMPDAGVSFLFGLYDLNTEFYVTPASGMFLNGSHGIGIDLGQTGMNGPSIFPNTALAFRFRYETSDAVTLSAAVVDGHPGTCGNPDRFDLSIRSSEGFLLIAESNIAPSDGITIGAGGWYYTAPFSDVCAVDGLEPDIPRYDNAGGYLLADALLKGTREDASGSVAVFLRLGLTNHHVNAVQSHFGSGVTVTGILGESDQAGYAVALAAFGPDFHKLSAFYGEAAAQFEAAHEISYVVPLFSGVSAQGDLQFIQHPSASVSIKSVTAIGLRLTAEF